MTSKLIKSWKINKHRYECPLCEWLLFTHWWIFLATIINKKKGSLIEQQPSGIGKVTCFVTTSQVTAKSSAALGCIRYSVFQKKLFKRQIFNFLGFLKSICQQRPSQFWIRKCHYSTNYHRIWENSIQVTKFSKRGLELPDETTTRQKHSKACLTFSPQDSFQLTF